jgi:rhamnopyranosyl-N-acetylglucosaminyl-diphospho-decaprenol beta-1,3/1,4-galactofuranosyltransferase
MKICALVVTYNNFEGLKKVIDNLLSQTRKPDIVLVIDNASEDNTSEIKDLFPIRYVRLKENAGSAGGYYEGLRLSCELADIVFVSDDDVLYELNVLEELEKSIVSLPDASALRCAWEGFTGSLPVVVESSVWTGTMIRSEIIKKIGLPLKELFLYAEDVEYFLRMGKYGFKMYVIPSAKYKLRTFEHKMEKKFLGRKIVFYKQPFRIYYAFRNEIYVAKLYHNIKEIVKTFFYAIRLSFVLRGREKILPVWEGIVDGFLNRLGKNEKYKIVRKD